MMKHNVKSKFKICIAQSDHYLSEESMVVRSNNISSAGGALMRTDSWILG
jgi:hypothetical protein